MDIEQKVKSNLQYSLQHSCRLHHRYFLNCLSSFDDVHFFWSSSALMIMTSNQFFTIFRVLRKEPDILLISFLRGGGEDVHTPLISEDPFQSLNLFRVVCGHSF